MRKDFGVKSWFYPLPVLILGTYNDDGSADAMNAAWGGLYDSDLVELCLSAGHRTTVNLKKRGAFTVGFATADHVAAADYVGIVSANQDPRKLEKSGYHAVPSQKVNAPILDELPVTLECEFVKTTEEGNVIGRIVNISVDEKVLAADGSLDMAKFRPISFEPAHNKYHVLGEVVGSAFQDGKALK